MLKNVLSRIGLFVSLYGYGIMMQPRQTLLTGTRGRVHSWSALFAVIAVASISSLIREVRGGRR